MSGNDMLQVVLALANAIVAVVLFVGLRRRKVTMRGLPIVLAAFFMLRAAKRLLDPFGLSESALDVAIDLLLLATLVLIVVRIGAIVEAFRAKEDAAMRSQVSYDLALSDLHQKDAYDLDSQLAQIDSALDELAGSAPGADAVDRARAAVATIREQRR